MKLIKLELKRTDFKGYLLAAAGISAFCLIMAFAFPLIPKIEERSVTGDDALLFRGEGCFFLSPVSSCPVLQSWAEPWQPEWW